MIRKIAAVWLLLSAAGFAQSGGIAASARKAIDAGNQAWVDGMKSGDAGSIAKVFESDALDCGPSGECTRGRAAIEQYLKARIAKTGRASAASVTSVGAVQQGDFVYEWGHSQVTLAKGVTRGGRYLTVWRKEPNGGWQIFRNMGIPADAR